MLELAQARLADRHVRCQDNKNHYAERISEMRTEARMQLHRELVLYLYEPKSLA
jgi:hypothetical protein